MKMPGAVRAFIEPAKIRDYLLSPVHPIGRFKAVFFARLGYTAANWQDLAAALRLVALRNDASCGAEGTYGKRFDVRATLKGPAGRKAAVVTAWIVRSGEDFPRFITAFPGDSR